MFILIKLNNIINLVGLSELLYSFNLSNPSGSRYKYYLASLESTMVLPRHVTLPPCYLLPLAYYYLYGDHTSTVPPSPISSHAKRLEATKPLVTSLFRLYNSIVLLPDPVNAENLFYKGFTRKNKTDTKSITTKLPSLVLKVSKHILHSMYS